MRLDAATIANLARAAGFASEDVAIATALAIASSGGHTHYHRTAGLPGTGDWRGLWAVDVDRVPLATGRDLWEPGEAARVTHELVRAYAGWEWSPVFVAGAWRPHMEHALTSSSRPTYRQPLSPPATAADRASVIRRLSHELDHARKVVRSVRRYRG